MQSELVCNKLPTTNVCFCPSCNFMLLRLHSSATAATIAAVLCLLPAGPGFAAIWLLLLAAALSCARSGILLDRAC